LNISSFLKKNKDENCYFDSIYLTGLSLLNGRRIFQANEMLRKVEKHILSFAEKQSMKSTGFNLIQSPHHNSSSESYKHLLKAAKIELIIADSLSPYSQLEEKIYSYRKVTELFMGNKSDISNSNANTLKCKEDAYTALIKLQPNLLKFLVHTLSDNQEPIKLACLRSLDYLLEILGGSIGNSFTQLLRYILSSLQTTKIVIDKSNMSTFEIT